ncbi:O-antigen ligase [Dyadobacter sp. CY326]|uniref:O-antigen ligase family protein n=1 Tax=Dyadobacter sp. CY326 TaxID=2907300 RepID=UPI001F45A218|nr:O-antigen ligase family protein [Dyadobacter sp. CY326]MCE7066567.1 O-antigen ligase family protein [Dyadobacter sp. CY326]
MNSFSIITKDKSLWLPALLIGGLFAVVPSLIFKYSFYLLFLITLLGFYLVLSRKAGVTTMIFAYSLMIPSTSSTIGLGATRYIAPLYIVVIILVYWLFTKSRVKYNFSFAQWIILPLLLFAFFNSARNNTVDEFVRMILFLISTFGVYYLTLLDRTNIRQFYALLDLIFYLTIIFVILEVLFIYTPYQIIYSEKFVDLQQRAKGLTGHPLVFSGFISFYIAALFVKGIILKHWSWFNMIMCVPFLILSASRTGLILAIASVLIYIFLEKKYKNSTFLITSVVAAMTVLILFPYLMDLINSTSLKRLQTANVDQRLGAYSVVANIFASNVFGIGFSIDALKSELAHGGFSLDSKFNSSFLVFDNAYLTLLTAYGIFSLLFYVIFVNPVRFCLKHKALGFTKISNSAILLFAIWFLQNFSFDSIFYFPVNSFYFILMGLLVRQIQQEKAAIQRSRIETHVLNEAH